MSKTYRVLDSEDYCVLTIVVKEGSTRITVNGLPGSRVVESSVATPVEAADSGAYHDWQATIETPDLIIDEIDKLGPSNVMPFGSVESLNIIFAQVGGKVTSLFSSKRPPRT